MQQQDTGNLVTSVAACKQDFLVGSQVQLARGACAWVCGVSLFTYCTCVYVPPQQLLASIVVTLFSPPGAAMHTYMGGWDRRVQCSIVLCTNCTVKAHIK